MDVQELKNRSASIFEIEEVKDHKQTTILFL